MDSKQPTSSDKKYTKRARDDDVAESSNATKRPKCAIEPLQLVDINDDCLEFIFQYLRIRDLINVAAAHDRFILASCSVFSRRCKDEWMYLDGNTLRREFKENGSRMALKGEIIVEGKKRLKQFFQLFAHSIANLSVQIRSNDRNSIDHRFVLKHCSAGLVKLTLNQCSDMVLRTIDKPFEGVKELCISDDFLRSNLSQLSVWFPAMDTLLLDEVNFMAQPDLCSQLKHFEMINEDALIPLPTIKQLLRMNPQLKSLNLRCDYDADFLRTISEYLPKLEELSLFSPNDLFKSFGTQNFIFENVKKFTLSNSHLFLVTAFSDLVQLPFVFNNLRELTMIGFTSSGGPLLTFIQRNKNLEKLHLGAYFDASTLDLQHMKALVKTLPNLAELQIDGDAFANDDLIEFLSTAQTLNKVQIMRLEAKRAEVIGRNKVIASQWIKHSHRDWILVDGIFAIFGWQHQFQRKSI